MESIGGMAESGWARASGGLGGPLSPDPVFTQGVLFNTPLMDNFTPPKKQAFRNFKDLKLHCPRLGTPARSAAVRTLPFDHQVSILNHPQHQTG
eukprot:1138632-Pelagomonas_calceolata.AAC.2